MTDADLAHLRRCVELAQEALEAGDEAFGSILVAADGRVLREERNRTAHEDPTAHPELVLAQWAARNLSPDERAACTVYTSTEHCAMCSAGHAMCGLGRIVYASSGQQLDAWRETDPSSPVAPLRIPDVAPHVSVEGPAPELESRLRALHGGG